jgi:RNA recognition motif-containing protein
MREFFLRFGKVVDATVMVDRESGRSKGFGFVTFEDSNNSEEFVGKLGLMLDDKQVRMDMPLNHILPHNIATDRSQSRSAPKPARSSAEHTSGQPRALLQRFRLAHTQHNRNGLPAAS